MKIQYTRYTELGCFTVRGNIGPNEWKMLRLGFDILFKDLEEMLVINMVQTEISSEEVSAIVEYKKLIPKLTKQKVFIISKEKGVGDFTKFELFLSRFQGSKVRQIGDKIILEDQIYALEQEITSIDAQIQTLGFDESTSKKEIQKNYMQKTEKKSLEGCIKWQKLRKMGMHKVPSTVEELDIKIRATLEEIAKYLGREPDL
jgi:hypothetical protein